jgi:hypothetical protein
MARHWIRYPGACSGARRCRLAICRRRQPIVTAASPGARAGCGAGQNHRRGRQPPNQAGAGRGAERRPVGQAKRRFRQTFGRCREEPPPTERGSRGMPPRARWSGGDAAPGVDRPVGRIGQSDRPMHGRILIGDEAYRWQGRSADTGPQRHRPDGQADQARVAAYPPQPSLRQLSAAARCRCKARGDRAAQSVLAVYDSLARSSRKP